MTAKDVLEFRDRKDKLKTIGEWKALGRELRDKYGISDSDAIDIMNGKNILEIMARIENDAN